MSLIPLGDTTWALRKALEVVIKRLLAVETNVSSHTFPATGIIMTCTNAPYRQYRVTIEDTAGAGNAVITLTPL